LAQEGISEESLNAGRKVLLVDTGFSGTIPRVIGGNFSVEAQKNIKTQLIVSSNESHPSSRLFLSYLNPSVNDASPSRMHATIVSYEHMPRYTDRSSKIEFESGRLHAISPTNGANDGTVSKEIAIKHMEDLK